MAVDQSTMQDQDRKDVERAIWYNDLLPGMPRNNLPNPVWSEDCRRMLPECEKQLQKYPADGTVYVLFDSFSKGHAYSTSWGIRSGQYGSGWFSWVEKISNTNHEDFHRVYVVRKPVE